MYQKEKPVNYSVKYFLCFVAGFAFFIGATLNYLGLFYFYYGKEKWIEHMANFSTARFAVLLIAAGAICIIYPIYVFSKKYRP